MSGRATRSSISQKQIYGVSGTWPCLSKDRNAPDLDQPPSETGKAIPAFPPITRAAPKRGSTKSGQPVARAPAIIVTVLVSAIVGLSLWYLVQPQPLLIQGEADATRIDIAARVEGRVAKRPVSRGENVAAGAVLYEIDNPELLTSLGRPRPQRQSPTPNSHIFKPEHVPRSSRSARRRSTAHRQSYLRSAHLRPDEGARCRWALRPATPRRGRGPA